MKKLVVKEMNKEGVEESKVVVEEEVEIKGEGDWWLRERRRRRRWS